MSRSRHSEAEMIAALKQVDAGRAVEDVGRVGRVEAHDLRLEGEVRRDGCELGAGGEAVARREHAAAKAGCGSEPGQGSAAVGDPKKRVELVGAAAGLDRGESGMGAGLRADAVGCGRAIRMLSLVDAYTRECLEAVKESNDALSFVMVPAH
jgi:hypothetical protein